MVTRELPSNKTLALINLMYSLILLGLFSKASIVLFISGTDKVSCWDFMIEKPKISKRFFNTSSYPYDTADQVTSTGHNL